MGGDICLLNGERDLSSEDARSELADRRVNAERSGDIGERGEVRPVGRAGASLTCSAVSLSSSSGDPNVRRESLGDVLALGREKLGLARSVALSAVGCLSEGERRSGDCDGGVESVESGEGLLNDDVAAVGVRSREGDVLGREKLGLGRSVAPSAVGCVSDGERWRGDCDGGAESVGSGEGLLNDGVAVAGVLSDANDEEEMAGTSAADGGRPLATSDAAR